jgi:hypothetical protein
MALLFGAATLLAVNPLNAGIILVGSASGVDTLTGVNTLITNYNIAFGASLNQVVVLVDKIEDAPSNLGTIWTNGNLNSGDFEFFQQTNGAGVDGKNIFNRNGANDVHFDNSALAGGANFLNSFSGVDNGVLGFKYNGPQQFQYYVSKNATGYSLWTFMPGGGLHPVYQDDTSDGATRGDISNVNLMYDPVKNAVSHISFYSAVPEPTSLVLVGFAVVGMCSVRRRWA